MAVGDALRRLCEEIGWSYAVFWKAIGAADPVHLVWEGGYCGHSPCSAGSELSEGLPTEVRCSAADGTVCSLVKKVMASQVYVVGEGTVGRAAFTGNHQWIVHSTANGHGLSSEVAAEMDNQFQAGIQTIAIIPVLPRGVLQLGSTGLVMENTNFVMYAKKLCSQLNNRSCMNASASVKNASSQHGQPRSSHGSFHVQLDDQCSKTSSRFPMAPEHRSSPDTATVSNSTLSNALLNASLLKAAQQNDRPFREHTIYAKPDIRVEQQTSYCGIQFGSNTQSADVSSGLVSPSLISVKRQSLLLNNAGSFGFSNNADSSADLARNILLKSLTCQDSSVHENANRNIACGRYEIPNGRQDTKNLDFLSGGDRVGRATSSLSQVQDQRCHSTSGALLQKQPLVPCKVPQLPEFFMKMDSLERGPFQAPPGPSSVSDGQVSNSLTTVLCQENQLYRSDHIHQEEMINGPANLSTQRVKHVDACRLPDMPNERSSSLLVDSTLDNDLFDMFGSEFQQFSHNVSADLVPCSGPKSQSLDRDVPESSIYFDRSLYGSLDNEIPYSGNFSLTDTDQLLDAVISNINPGGKQSPDDSASCKTSLIDIPSTSHIGKKEMKQYESSGVPSVLIKHESVKIIKQPCFFDKPEDGCLSQNNGAQKSQIRLWIESGQNMKCESASASNSKGLDTPSKTNRKRSRPGESAKPRPKDRQLIQDRIKELRELVPNGAKCSIDALLDKTVKHMLFLQSVTKHADKLKHSSESKKILGGENGPLWKDYFEGGATWAFEVGSQSMTCPIIVEDLDRPRQMLVEMLCEDRGIFLEIADFIKGLGLTILRGVMEVRKNKIWARFTVEANRDVTRMEIFLSLVRLLEPNCDGTRAAENANNVNMPLGLVHQPVIPATGRIQ